MIEILHSKLTKGQEKYVLTGGQRGHYIGSGATAEVRSYGRKRVIRVQETSEDYDAADVLPWAQLCVKSRSRHVPKVDFLAVERDEDGDVKRVVTVLERLEEADTTKGLNCDNDVYVIDRFLSGNRKLQYGEMSRAARMRFPRSAIISLKKSIKAADLYFNDLHDGNWMVRKSDGRLVITDPIA